MCVYFWNSDPKKTRRTYSSAMKFVCRCIVLVFLSAFFLADGKPIFDGKIRTQEDGTRSAFLTPPFKSNHASTLEQLPDGSLALAWFSGEAEEADRCSIVFSTLSKDSDRWENATVLSVQEGYSDQNPVLFYDSSASLLRLYHSHAPAKSGESESVIFELNSSDLGATWTDPSIFLGGTFPGAFPRNRIIYADDGGLLFPIYNAKDQYSIIDRSTIDRRRWDALKVEDSKDLVQPTMIRLNDNRTLRAWFRDRRSEHIYTATSIDDGRTFTSPKPSGLPNPNSGIEANVLSVTDRTLAEDETAVVLVFNNYNEKNKTKYGRTPLNVALSYDGGVTWPHIRALQKTNDGEAAGASVEFSYPSVLQTADGIIHISYTYDRDTIKYRQITEQWIRNDDEKHLS